MSNKLGDFPSCENRSQLISTACYILRASEVTAYYPGCVILSWNHPSLAHNAHISLKHQHIAAVVTMANLQQEATVHLARLYDMKKPPMIVTKFMLPVPDKVSEVKSSLNAQQPANKAKRRQDQIILFKGQRSYLRRLCLH